MYLISLIATVIVALISSHNQMTASVMASGLGFLLSLNLLQLLVDIARSFTVWRRFKDVCQTLHYTSYCCLKSNQVQSLRHICLKYVTSLLRNTTLLLFSILLVYFTASRQASSTVLIVVHALMIVLGTFEVSFKVASELYCCGIRNPFHPRRKDSLSYFKSRRRLLFFLSFPRQLLLLYSKSGYHSVHTVCISLSLSFMYGDIYWTQYSNYKHLHGMVWYSSTKTTQKGHYNISLP